MDNPGVKLPHQAIVPVHRTDGSGDTFIFTQYLSDFDTGLGEFDQLRAPPPIVPAIPKKPKGRGGLTASGLM